MHRQHRNTLITSNEPSRSTRRASPVPRSARSSRSIPRWSAMPCWRRA